MYGETKKFRKILARSCQAEGLTAVTMSVVWDFFLASQKNGKDCFVFK